MWLENSHSSSLWALHLVLVSPSQDGCSDRTGQTLGSWKYSIALCKGTRILNLQNRDGMVEILKKQDSDGRCDRKTTIHLFRGHQVWVTSQGVSREQFLNSAKGWAASQDAQLPSADRTGDVRSLYSSQKLLNRSIVPVPWELINMEAPEQPFFPKALKYLSAVDGGSSFIMPYSFLRCLLPSARELCQMAPQSHRPWTSSFAEPGIMFLACNRFGTKRECKTTLYGALLRKHLHSHSTISPSFPGFSWMGSAVADGRCLWRAGCSPGGTAPTWSPEMGRKATTQRAGQVMVAGPYPEATYPVVSPCPQQLLKGGNITQGWRVNHSSGT